MSIAALVQVYDEVRRLSIAGSVVAPGDFRLKKLVAPLEQAGAKAPVFAKVAQAVTKLVDGTEKTSAESLLELSGLVNAILYTQGETGLAGDFTNVNSIDLGQNQTQTSARVLKPLLEALTTTGSGRLELIRDAFEQGKFRDLRLVSPALAAIDDVYPEIAELISEKVLPLYGTAILPELRRTFDPKGKSGQARRLELMHALDPVGTRDLVKRTLEEGSKEVKVAAIACLGEDDNDLAYLLEQIRAKAREVRVAAFRAIGKLPVPDAIKALCGAIKSDDVELVVGAVQSHTSPEVTDFVLAETKSVVESLLAGKEKDKKALGKKVSRLLSLLECLRKRTDDSVVAFLTALYQDRTKLKAIKAEPGGADIEFRLVSVLADGPAQLLGVLLANHAELNPESLKEVFWSALQLRPASEVYDLFSPYLTASASEKKKLRDPANAGQQAILEVLREVPAPWAKFVFGDETTQPTNTEQLDVRWLDLLIKLDFHEHVAALARADHAGAMAYLKTTFDRLLATGKDVHVVNPILRAMVRRNHPDATDAVIAVIEKFAKSPPSSLRYHYFPEAGYIVHLPKSSAEKFEALLPKLPDVVANAIVDYVAELKNRAE